MAGSTAFASVPHEVEAKKQAKNVIVHLASVPEKQAKCALEQHPAASAQLAKMRKRRVAALASVPLWNREVEAERGAVKPSAPCLHGANFVGLLYK